MTKETYLRFNAEAGGISVFLNGFLIVAPNETGRFATRVAPYLRPGENLLQIDARPAPGRPLKASIVDMRGGDPENPNVLLDVDLPDIQFPDGLWQGTFEISEPVADFGWHAAHAVNQNDVAGAYDVLTALGTYLQNGPTDALVELLDMKHREIANSIGLAKSEMDNGLRDGLAEKRSAPTFKVEVTPFNNFLPVWSPDLKILNAKSKDGGDAIRITDSDISGGFTVALSQLNGKWVIVR